MCQTCAGRLSLGAREHEIRDGGRVWRFEVHPYLGPVLIGKGGDPLSRQPGSRSPFWPAFERWQVRTA